MDWYQDREIKLIFEFYLLRPKTSQEIKKVF